MNHKSKKRSYLDLTAKLVSHRWVFVEQWYMCTRRTLPCVLSHKASNLLKVLHRSHGFASTLIWYHTDIYKENAGTNRLKQKYKYILTLPVIRTQPLPVLHWMNNLLIQNFTLQRSTMSLLLKNYPLVEVIVLIIKFNKTQYKEYW